MSNPTVDAAPERKPLHWPSLIAMVLGMGGILLLMGVSATGFIGGVISLFSPMIGSEDAPQLFSYAVGGLFLSLLLLPAVVLGIRRLGGHSGDNLPAIFKRAVQRLHPRRLMILYPVVVLAGWWFDSYSSINWVFMPVLNMLALSLPAAWLVWQGTRNFPPRSAQRNWSALAVGMTFGPILILVIEILVLILGVVLISVLVSMMDLSANPAFQELIQALEQLSGSGEIPEQLIISLAQNPLVISVILLFISGVVPIIEEIFKPVAVWASWNRPLTPQDGWTLGLLSGAGFALMENFGNVAVGDGWAFVALARAGATALHMFNTALIGYTFVLARQKKRRLLPLVSLGIAILVHAAWNAMTVFAVVGALDSPVDSQIWPVRYILLLVVMSLSLIVGILLVNRQLAKPAPEADTLDAAEIDSPVEDAGS